MWYCFFWFSTKNIILSKLFIDYGAIVTIDNNAALLAAVEAKNLEIVKLLLTNIRQKINSMLIN